MKAPAAESIDWGKGDGLVPAVVQDASTGAVLMLGYLDRRAYEQTLAGGELVFFSRSRQRLWRKGETSGNVLRVREVLTDCDCDALLVRADPAGPTCHLGTRSCFGEAVPATLLDELETVIADRLEARPEGSYVTRLAAAGTDRAAQKLAEEGVETALAAVTRDAGGVTEEAADLMFHLLVLLQLKGLGLRDVLACLAARRR
jgi:phosphoribosyl-AMP cyclohydrolase / phosphoribosyl-ATP pyrophosphohydrolase